MKKTIKTTAVFVGEEYRGAPLAEKAIVYESDNKEDIRKLKDLMQSGAFSGVYFTAEKVAKRGAETYGVGEVKRTATVDLPAKDVGRIVAPSGIELIRS